MLLLIITIVLFGSSTSRVRNSCKEHGLEKREIKKSLQQYTNKTLTYDRKLRQIAEFGGAVGLEVKSVREGKAVLSSFYGDNNQLVKKLGWDWKKYLAKLKSPRIYFGCSCGKTRHNRTKIFCIFSESRVARQSVEQYRLHTHIFSESMDGYDPVLFPTPIIFGTLSTIGITGNIIMVIATYKAKRMKSPCHILIASNCLADAIHETGQYAFVYHFFNKSFMTQSDCFYLLSVPILGASFGSPLILCLGIDRLIAIKFPSRYRFFQTMPYTYIAAHMVFPTLYALYIVAWSFVTRNEAFVQCSVPQGFGVGFAVFNQAGTAVNVAIVAAYITAYIILKRSNASSKMKIVFKSIFVTVAVVMGGWFATFVVNNLCPYITSDEYWTMVINMYAGIMVNGCGATNVFVYYSINTEYREVIRTMFGMRTPVKKIHEVSTMHGLDSTKTASPSTIAILD
ncbi:unnamed protein product [Cylicocyclus nassatus]|uniref:G-protein coupled receptors family 1 profile domain-containing protein n=1 Tax=Cylicocyclus nassatus TaxID=53992 RepID=A0AA36GI59_CYLNA|nr:unnamed protein product [Cylicocyclus nassatus]